MPRGAVSEVGAKTVNQNGYEQTKTEEGWVGSHVLLMEEHLGRKLGPSERVRFKDGDRKNICVENLEIYYLKSGSLKRKLAAVEDRIRELQADREYILSQLDELEASSRS